MTSTRRCNDARDSSRMRSDGNTADRRTSTGGGADLIARDDDTRGLFEEAPAGINIATFDISNEAERGRGMDFARRSEIVAPIIAFIVGRTIARQIDESFIHRDRASDFIHFLAKKKDTTLLVYTIFSRTSTSTLRVEIPRRPR